MFAKTILKILIALPLVAVVDHQGGKEGVDPSGDLRVLAPIIVEPSKAQAAGVEALGAWEDSVFDEASAGGRTVKVDPVGPKVREAGVQEVLIDPPLVVPRDAKCPQWWYPAVAAGWSEENLRDMDVVIYRESRCLVDVHNKKDPNGGSRGLLQINGSWTKWLRDRGILKNVNDLYNPEVNLRAALAIYDYGIDKYDFGWGPWGFRYKDPYKD